MRCGAIQRLKKAGVVRLVDLLVVRKDSTGAVATLTASDLEWDEAVDFGATIGSLIGWGAAGAEGAAVGALTGAAELADGHAFDGTYAAELVEELPPNMSTAIALIEHVWAKPLRAAIARAGGLEVANEWLQADELIAIGLAAAAPDDAPLDDEGR